MKLFIFIGVNLGGYVGWAGGEHFGIIIAFLLSSVGSLAGVVGGWWMAQRYLS